MKKINILDVDFLTTKFEENVQAKINSRIYIGYFLKALFGNQAMDRF